MRPRPRLREYRLTDVVVDCAIKLTREKGGFTYNQVAYCVYSELQKHGIKRRPKLESIKRTVRRLRERGFVTEKGRVPRRWGEDQIVFAYRRGGERA